MAEAICASAYFTPGEVLALVVELSLLGLVPELLQAAAPTVTASAIPDRSAFLAVLDASTSPPIFSFLLDAFSWPPPAVATVSWIVI
jgi:hypothetical protein